MADDSNCEEAQSKNLFAHAGRTLYLAQCFEMSFENILCLYARLSLKSLTLAEFENFEKGVQKETLGQLLNKVRGLVKFGEGADAVLTTALEQRNFFVHRFFKERADQALPPKGSALMIDELIEIQRCLQEADLVASVVYKALGKALGISDEMVERKLDELKSK
ncbi:MAG TPA: hypothetical protein VHH73_00115 [Verrucomicrobiae bacterium]|nr:hypothetical protein [Verrucomicrobiae bacterium]